MSPPNLSPQRGSVIQISPEQWDALEAQFAKVKNPHPTDLVLLAAEIGLDESDVQVIISHSSSLN
jgi:Homeodomain